MEDLGSDVSPGTKTGTRVRSHVPPERKPGNEGTFAKTTLLRNRPCVSSREKPWASIFTQLPCWGRCRFKLVKAQFPFRRRTPPPIEDKLEHKKSNTNYRRGIGDRVEGVTAIVHEKQRSSYHKELVARYFPLFFWGFEAQLLAQ